LKAISSVAQGVKTLDHAMRGTQQKNSTAAFFVVWIGSMVELRTPAALEIALHCPSFQPIAIFRQRLGVNCVNIQTGLKAYGGD
jgi:hypothetical protein